MRQRQLHCALAFPRCSVAPSSSRAHSRKYWRHAGASVVGARRGVGWREVEQDKWWRRESEIKRAEDRPKNTVRELEARATLPSPPQQPWQTTARATSLWPASRKVSNGSGLGSLAKVGGKCVDRSTATGCSAATGGRQAPDAGTLGRCNVSLKRIEGQGILANGD